MLRLLFVGLLALAGILPTPPMEAASCLPDKFRWNGGVWLHSLGTFDADLNRYWQDVYVADVSSLYERRCNGLEE